jgi:hypothetical protein
MSLLGLPDTYRLACFNATGITISNFPTGLPRASGRRVRYDSNGVLSYEAAEFTFFSFAATTIGNNSYVTGSTLSNTLSNWGAIDGLFSCFASANASGNVYLYMENSPDGGTTWPTPASANGPGGALLVAVIGYGGTTTNSTASTVQRIGWTYP